MQLTRQLLSYIILLSLTISGLATSTVVASKILHIGINFPAANLTFSILSYPMINCICELWGKRLAKQSLVIAVGCQALIALLIRLIIALPSAPYWDLSKAFYDVLASSSSVLAASLLAFGVSQLLDIIIYQHIKKISHGRQLWLRSNVSTICGQIIDAAIFVIIVFHASTHQWNIYVGAITVKIVLSILMTPAIYLVVIGINRWLGGNTMAFKFNQSLTESD
ncbi:MAG: queuosine precursor transporter [Coxiellaceae bacterium]|nr:queuosine precursor transporter [Coxiellaceae bacterium]